ncbi:hypothetical protein ABZV61_10970 [Streptomyces sp900116325]|uniref:Uncharacterized protein n=1 Tax=Streptomyces sp. 900116325 TaxID=3154295 RepID=A0ABV2U652_9ACTN
MTNTLGADPDPAHLRTRELGDETAITKIPESPRETSLNRDGTMQDGYPVAELTGVNTRDG